MVRRLFGVRLSEHDFIAVETPYDGPSYAAVKKKRRRPRKNVAADEARSEVPAKPLAAPAAAKSLTASAADSSLPMSPTSPVEQKENYEMDQSTVTSMGFVFRKRKPLLPPLIANVASQATAGDKFAVLLQTGFAVDAEKSFGEDAFGLIDLVLRDFFAVRDIKAITAKHSCSPMGCLPLPQEFAAADFIALLERLQQGLASFFETRLERLEQEIASEGVVPLFLSCVYIEGLGDAEELQKLIFVVDGRSGLPVYWRLGAVEKKADVNRLKALVDHEMVDCYHEVVNLSQKLYEEIKPPSYAATAFAVNEVAPIAVLLAAGCSNLDNFLSCNQYGLGMVCHVPERRLLAKDACQAFLQYVEKEKAHEKYEGEFSYVFDDGWNTIYDCLSQSLSCLDHESQQTMVATFEIFNSVYMQKVKQKLGLQALNLTLEMLEHLAWQIENNAREVDPTYGYDKLLANVEKVKRQSRLLEDISDADLHRFEVEIRKHLTKEQREVLDNKFVYYEHRARQYGINSKAVEAKAIEQTLRIFATMHLKLTSQQLYSCYEAYCQLVAKANPLSFAPVIMPELI